MPALLRRPVSGFAVMGLIVAASLGMVMMKSGRVHGLGPGAAQAAVSSPSPYVAVAEGKADVEGGVISVAPAPPASSAPSTSRRATRWSRARSWPSRKMMRPGWPPRPRWRIWARPRRRSARPRWSCRRPEREYQRVEPLADSKIISGQDVDKAHDAILTADALLGVQRATVGEARPSSPRRATAWNRP